MSERKGAAVDWPWLAHVPGEPTVMHTRVSDSPARGDITPDPDAHEYIAYRGGRHVAFTDTEAEMRFELDDNYRAALVIARTARSVEDSTTPDGLPFQVIRAAGGRAALIVGDFAAAALIRDGDDANTVAESLRWAV